MHLSIHLFCLSLCLPIYELDVIQPGFWSIIIAEPQYRDVNLNRICRHNNYDVTCLLSCSPETCSSLCFLKKIRFVITPCITEAKQVDPQFLFTFGISSPVSVLACCDNSRMASVDFHLFWYTSRKVLLEARSSWSTPPWSHHNRYSAYHASIVMLLMWRHWTEPDSGPNQQVTTESDDLSRMQKIGGHKSKTVIMVALKDPARAICPACADDTTTLSFAKVLSASFGSRPKRLGGACCFTSPGGYRPRGQL